MACCNLWVVWTLVSLVSLLLTTECWRPHTLQRKPRKYMAHSMWHIGCFGQAVAPGNRVGSFIPCSS
eukprot:SAG31_NODE_1289_length_8983_cov_9.783543_11_plen_67_part_00